MHSSSNPFNLSAPPASGQSRQGGSGSAAFASTNPFRTGYAIHDASNSSGSTPKHGAFDAPLLGRTTKIQPAVANTVNATNPFNAVDLGKFGRSSGYDGQHQHFQHWPSSPSATAKPAKQSDLALSQDDLSWPPAVSSAGWNQTTSEWPASSLSATNNVSGASTYPATCRKQEASAWPDCNSLKSSPGYASGQSAAWSTHHSNPQPSTQQRANSTAGRDLLWAAFGCFDGDPDAVDAHDGGSQTLRGKKQDSRSRAKKRHLPFGRPPGHDSEAQINAWEALQSLFDVWISAASAGRGADAFQILAPEVFSQCLAGFLDTWLETKWDGAADPEAEALTTFLKQLLQKLRPALGREVALLDLSPLSRALEFCFKLIHELQGANADRELCARALSDIFCVLSDILSPGALRADGAQGLDDLISRFLSAVSEKSAFGLDAPEQMAAEAAEVVLCTPFALANIVASLLCSILKTPEVTSFIVQCGCDGTASESLKMVIEEVSGESLPLQEREGLSRAEFICAAMRNRDSFVPLQDGVSRARMLVPKTWSSRWGCRVMRSDSSSEEEDDVDEEAEDLVMTLRQIASDLPWISKILRQFRRALSQFKAYYWYHSAIGRVHKSADWISGGVNVATFVQNAAPMFQEVLHSELDTDWLAEHIKEGFRVFEEEVVGVGCVDIPDFHDTACFTKQKLSEAIPRFCELLFRLLDIDGSGVIDWRELQVLKALAEAMLHASNSSDTTPTAINTQAEAFANAIFDFLDRENKGVLKADDIAALAVRIALVVFGLVSVGSHLISEILRRHVVGKFQRGVVRGPGSR